MATDWGPLWALAGQWEGDVGLDTSYSHGRDEMLLTPYREQTTLHPFGPVRNGDQQLFGLDYRSAMWRNADTDPFHTEAGYWLWDALTGQVIRAIAVPRGITVLAGGTAAPDDSELSLAADLDGTAYRIAENPYLTKRASSLSYRATITLHADTTWTYDETILLKMSERPEPVAHTDTNTMRRVS